MKMGTPGFSGKRLEEARLGKSMTLTTLAELIDVSKTTISKYEKNLSSPRPEIMERISDLLDKPLSYFTTQERNYTGSSVFFRSLSSSTKMDRQMANTKLLWILDIIQYLESFIELPKVDFPSINIENPLSISDDKIEEIAKACRKYWGLEDDPVIHLVNALQNKGCIISRWETDSKALDAFSWVVNDRPIIILTSNKESAVRSRFDAAHELGHLLLHKKINITPSQLKLIETQADRFAAAFLLPERQFIKDVSKHGAKIDTFWMLKDKWKVSIAAMIMRSQQIGLINESQKRNLFIYLSKKGWRKKEPLDDRIEIEKPTYLEDAIRILVENDIQSKDSFKNNTRLSEKDITKLTGLPEFFFSDSSSKIKILPKFNKKQPISKNKKEGKIIPIRRKNDLSG